MHTRTQKLLNRNRAFGGAVFSPAQPLPEAELTQEIPFTTIDAVESRGLPDNRKTTGVRSFLLARLMAVVPTSTALCQERDELIAQASGFGEAVDRFLDVCDEEQRLALEQQHEEVRRQGREQSRLCERLARTFASANGAWNNAADAKAHALDALRQANYQQAHPARWASDTEIRDAKEKVALAKMRADKAIEKENEAIAERNRAEQALLDAKAKLNQLGNEETRLHCALSGQAYTDPELGLSVA